MRTRYVAIPGGGWREVPKDWVPEPSTGVMIMPDIKPYTSVIDGSVINSRSTHRAHLRQHKVVEVGNEKLPAKQYDFKPQGLRNDMNKAWDQLRK